MHNLVLECTNVFTMISTSNGQHLSIHFIYLHFCAQLLLVELVMVPASHHMVAAVVHHQRRTLVRCHQVKWDKMTPIDNVSQTAEAAVIAHPTVDLVLVSACIQIASWVTKGAKSTLDLILSVIHLSKCRLYCWSSNWCIVGINRLWL